MTSFRSILIHSLLIPSVRTYVRYAPGAFAKRALWKRFGWHPHGYSVSTRDGVQMTGNATDFVQNRIYYFGIWEPHLTAWLKSILQPGDTFVDVGANVGYFTLLASKIVGPKGRVISIEACPSIYEHLVKNISLNKLTNVVSLNRAITDACGRVEIFRAANHNLGASSLLSASDSVSEGFVEAATLSDVLAENGGLSARAIKIDVEGAESSVVTGMLPLSRFLHPQLEIAMELSNERTPTGARNACEIVAAFRQSGFVPMMLQNDYSILRDYFNPPSIPMMYPLLDLPAGLVDVVFSRSKAYCK